MSLMNSDNHFYRAAIKSFEAQREEAIATSAKLAQDGDVVLIAGKGHESYQEIQGKYYPFNDLKVAKQIFLNLD